MRTCFLVLVNSFLALSDVRENSTITGPRVKPVIPNRQPAAPESPIQKVSEMRSSDSIARFSPSVPSRPLKLEQVPEMHLNMKASIIDGTEYAESREHLVPREPRSRHFLRKSEPTGFEKDRKSSQSTLDVDESDLESAFQDGIDGLKESFDSIVSALETAPTHPAVEEVGKQVDMWAQETRAGFMGYWERLESVWKSESKSVGKKLFEAADAYSHRFFTLVHVKESDHPVLAAKVTRIIVAMGLSLALVFVIFGLALQLQKSIIARAHEEASKQQPQIQEKEKLFFAMPYPQAGSNGNIVVVE